MSNREVFGYQEPTRAQSSGTVDQLPFPPQENLHQNISGNVRAEHSEDIRVWKRIGCLAFLMLSFNTFCFLLMSMVIMDVLNLWRDLPVIRDVVL